MLEVAVTLGLLGLNFALMFIVSVFGVNTSTSAEYANREGCFICDSSQDTAVSGYPVCSDCKSEFF